MIFQKCLGINLKRNKKLRTKRKPKVKGKRINLWEAMSSSVSPSGVVN